MPAGKHFGIGFRLIAGLGVLTAVIVIMAVAFIVVIDRFEANLGAVTDKGVPAITAASRLSRLSNAITNHGPWMLLAESEWRRRVEYGKALDEARWLEDELDKIENSSLPRETKAQLLALSRSLLDHYARLDSLTRQRIAHGKNIDRLYQRIEATIAEVSNLERQRGADTTLAAWANNAHAVLTNLLSALRQQHPAPLSRIKRDHAEQAGGLVRAFADLTGAARRDTTPIQGRILELGDGEGAVYQIKERQLDTRERIDRLLSTTTQAADEFLALTSNAVYQLTTTLESERQRSAGELSMVLNVVLLVAVACALLAGGLLVFIYDRVIRRLRALQTSMQAHAQGDGTAAIDVSGSDEITGMARDLQVFVDTIGHREAALREAKDRAERADTAKTDFLAAASHDLRQPLQAINLFVAVLAEQETDPAKTRVIDRVRDSLGALGTLLDSLLDISKLEAGMVVPEERDFPISMILRRLKEEFGQVAAQKGLAFSCVVSNRTVRSDPALLETVVRNLTNNAIKYTATGKVLLGCRRRGAMLDIEVWDTGFGIPADQKDLIFQDFYQIHNPTRERGQGLGLGLSIVDRLGRLLNSRVGLESWPGRGSVFRVSVPLADAVAVPERRAATIVPRAEARSRTIAVLEDEQAVLDALTTLLNGWGFTVIDLPCLRCAETRDRLLTRAEPPDLLIVDYRLERDLDGRQAIRSVREHFGQPVPALLITGDTAPERLREVEASGLTVLHKPVQADALRHAIVRSLDGIDGLPN